MQGNKGRRWITATALLMVLAASFLFVSCGGSGGPGSGTVNVAITDASGQFDAVVLSIGEIRLVPEGQNGEGAADLPLVAAFDPPRTVDISQLVFTQEILGEAVVPAGRYHQIRLVLEENLDPLDPANYIILAGMTEKIPLTTPSGQTSGVKILLKGQFTVEAGELTAVVIDFEPDRAIVQSGGSGEWNLKPTGIRVVELAQVLQTYGSLSGTVMPQVIWPTAVVSVWPEGGSAPFATGLLNPDDGSFRAHLPAGFYEVRVAAEGYEPFTTAPIFYEVVVGSDTPVDPIVLTTIP